MDLANLVQGSWPSHVIDVYGPDPPGVPIPTFPAGAERPVVFPDEPTPGIRATVEHLCGRSPTTSTCASADEGRANVAESIRVHEIGVRRDGYVPDIDLGVAATAARRRPPAPAMDPVVDLPARRPRGHASAAILVQHAPVFPAFGFRVDTPHGSVAFSGDTGAVRQRRAPGQQAPTSSSTRSSTSTASPSACRACPTPTPSATTWRRPTRRPSRSATSPPGPASARSCCPTSCPATATRATRSGRPGSARTSTARSSAASTSTSSPSRTAR